MANRKRRKQPRYFDFALLFIILFLLVFGLIVLYSTSSYNAQLKTGDSLYYLKNQTKNTIIGIAAMILFITVDYHLCVRCSVLAYIGAIILCFMVKFTPLGVEYNGARRWLNLGIQFQPAEVAKIALVLFLAFYIVKLGKRISQFKSLVLIMVFSIVMAGCVYILTDNLSSGIIIGGIGVVMAFVAYPDAKPFVIGGTVVALIVGILLYYIFNIMVVDENTGFRWLRILVWKNPENYASGKGYQTLQALYAIGSGSFFGKGLGKSIQKLGYIPEAQNDMIFSIICEELGLFGALCILLIFAMMIWRFMYIASNAPDLQGSLVVVGIMAHIAIQVILNVAVVANVIPNTGITLPFISYGGTSVVFLLMEMGIALNVSSKIKIEN